MSDKPVIHLTVPIAVDPKAIEETQRLLYQAFTNAAQQMAVTFEQAAKVMREAGSRFLDTPSIREIMRIAEKLDFPDETKSERHRRHKRIRNERVHELNDHVVGRGIRRL